jgi:hypothetical protein
MYFVSFAIVQETIIMETNANYKNKIFWSE